MRISSYCRPQPRLLLLGGALLLACSSSDGPGRPDANPLDRGALGDTAHAELGQTPVACPLGTVYPNGVVINPDDPGYSEPGLTNDQVRDKFAGAKAADAPAYRAYRAAFRYPDLLECAFCTCGCDGSVAHRSAVDCFKDLHGFG